MAPPVHIRVLGSRGVDGAGFFTPSLLIDGRILLDAGSFGADLGLDEQLRIDHVVLSHAHLDHVQDLAQFADLIIGHRRRPVRIHATAASLEVLRGDLFNNRLWPDFFALPSPEAPVLLAAPVSPGRSFRIGRLRFTAHRVSHPVDSVGYVVRSPRGSFVYSGDTGPTDALWRAVNRLHDLKLLLVETKFPDELQFVADASGHLTPRTLSGELRKLRAAAVPVVLYHVKPDRFDQVARQVAALGDRRIRLMGLGDRYRI